jgi:hypothetical protein
VYQACPAVVPIRPEADMRTPRPVRAALVTLAVATLVTLSVAAAGPAQAGGPTSVLLVAPGGGGTAALYYDDAEYDELTRLLGDGADPAASGGRAEEDHATGSQVNVTWLIHDVMVWRVDRIYVGAPGGPWVGTQVSFGSDVMSAPLSWHRPAEPKALVALLERLGVDAGSGGEAADPQQEPVRAAAAPSPAPSATAAAAVPREAGPSAGVRWLLVAGAFLAGVAVSAVWTRRLSRRVPAGPADQPPASPDDQADRDQPDWSSVEELASRH